VALKMSCFDYIKSELGVENFIKTYNICNGVVVAFYDIGDTEYQHVGIYEDGYIKHYVNNNYVATVFDSVSRSFDAYDIFIGVK